MKQKAQPSIILLKILAVIRVFSIFQRRVDFHSCFHSPYLDISRLFFFIVLVVMLRGLNVFSSIFSMTHLSCEIDLLYSEYSLQH